MIRPVTLAAAALLSAGALVAQTSQAGKPSAYGSPSQGVARPADEPILANIETDAAQVPPQTAPATQAAPPQVAPIQAAPNQVAPRSSAPAANPDAGIVEVPVPDEATPPVRTTAQPVLKSHVYNPDAEIVTSVPLSPNQLPEGTPFHARLVEQISAETVTPGTPFTAQLTLDIVHMGRTVIPAGSYIHGRVTDVSAGRRIGGQSTIRLTPDEVVLPDGTHYRFRGIVTQTAGSNTKTDAEGYVINRDHPGPHCSRVWHVSRQRRGDRRSCWRTCGRRRRWRHRRWRHDRTLAARTQRSSAAGRLAGDIWTEQRARTYAVRLTHSGNVDQR